MAKKDKEYKDASLEALLERAEKADAEETAAWKAEEADTPRSSQGISAEEKEMNARDEKARKVFKHLTDIDAEEDVPMNLRAILGGDILGGRAFRRQIGYVLLLSVMAIIYVGCRYACQREIITGRDLDKKIEDIEFKVLTANSELTELQMRSRIEEALPDTSLHVVGGRAFTMPVSPVR